MVSLDTSKIQVFNSLINAKVSTEVSNSIIRPDALNRVKRLLVQEVLIDKQ